MLEVRQVCKYVIFCRLWFVSKLDFERECFLKDLQRVRLIIQLFCLHKIVQIRGIWSIEQLREQIFCVGVHFGLGKFLNKWEEWTIKRGTIIRYPLYYQGILYKLPYWNFRVEESATRVTDDGSIFSSKTDLLLLKSDDVGLDDIHGGNATYRQALMFIFLDIRQTVPLFLYIWFHLLSHKHPRLIWHRLHWYSKEPFDYSAALR